jgi:hypothetical protein
MKKPFTTQRTTLLSARQVRAFVFEGEKTPWQDEQL